MPVEARLILFSGRPNLRWTLSPAQVTRLAAELRDLPRLVAPPPDYFRPAGGYRGIQIALPHGHTTQDVVIFGQLVSVDGLYFRDANRMLELSLLRASPFLGELGISTEELLKPPNEQQITGIIGSANGDSCSHGTRFPHKVFTWDSHKNNCYSYANNKRNTDPAFDGAQPGGATPDFTADAFIRAAVADGLQHLGKALPAACPVEPHAHYLAICFVKHADGKVKDYHCLRLDKNGNWSHKNGPDPVTKEDVQGQLMSNLDTVKLYGAPELVGFFKSIKNKRHIKFS